MTSHTHSLIERLDQPSHTPGPWSIDDSSGQDIVFGSDGMPVAHAIHRENWPADARLIAAAPDLVKALEVARNELMMLGEPGSTAELVVDQIDAALTSAKGSGQ